MTVFLTIAGVGIILFVLLEAFETIILPRQVTRRWRLTRLFYRATWRPYVALVRPCPKKGRERLLSFYGPLSFVLLLVFWGLLLLLGFALLHLVDGSVARLGNTGLERLGMALYFSGSTLFTLGLGDIAPHTPLSRFLTVAEAFTGLGFLAIVVGYFRVLYQAFSRREAQITLLDARAGSPPSATELLRRMIGGGDYRELHELLEDWERWCAELLESHISYPVLCYFRSQHDNESWLASVATILDTSALVLVGIDDTCQRQAQLTFAIARHAVVDLSQVLGRKPDFARRDRLSPEDLERMRTVLSDAGVQLRRGEEADDRLAELRSMYEPYVHALAEMLMMPLPAWIREGRPDNWQTSSWGRITGDGRTRETKVETHL
ncbi:MAG TPA: potassium channel family protein [Terriglobales bacterium]|nr:potassium channel family protein [Terriglobales bacterium]